MKTIRLTPLAIAVAIASATGASAHDGAAPHSHGSADPRPLSAVEPFRGETTEREVTALLDRVAELRDADRRDRREDARETAR